MKTTKPLIYFDLETTGTDIAKDRIVSLACLKVFPKGHTEEKYTLINPGRPIPAGATKIHGIKDEDVKDAPVFKQISKSLFDFMEGCDFAGYNIVYFDVPLIAEEFARCGLVFPHDKARFLDACTIFKKKEERTLTAAYRFFCNKIMEGAHNALNDVKATKEILEAQMVRYEDLSTVTNVAAFCETGYNCDLAGRIIKDKDGDYIYNFGKSKGKRVKDDPSFAEWMLTQDFITLNTKITTGKILEELRKKNASSF